MRISPIHLLAAGGGLLVLELLLPGFVALWLGGTALSLGCALLGGPAGPRTPASGWRLRRSQRGLANGRNRVLLITSPPARRIERTNSEARPRG